MTTMNDHVNIPNLAFWGVGLLLAFFIPIGIEYSNSHLTNDILFIYSIIFFSVFCLTGLRMEFWYRPKSIDIMDDGVVLNFYIRRSRKHLWSEIDKINVITDPTFKRSWNYVDGTLDLKSVSGKRSKGYVLHYTLVLAIRERYKDAVGLYPFNSKSKPA